MPRIPGVPTYGGPKVTSTPLPGVRKNAHATYASEGGAVGEAIAGLGERTARLGAELLQQANDQRDAIAETTWNRELKQARYRGMTAPTTGIINHRGLGAMAALEPMLAAFDKETGEMEQRLRGHRQQVGFAAARDATRAALLDEAMQFGQSELSTYEAREAEASLTTALQMAIAHAGNLPRIAAELADGEGIIDRHAAAIGLGPQAIAARKAAFRSEAHVGVVEELLAQEQPAQALAYYEETEDQIQSDKHADLKKALTEGNLRARSQHAADLILGSTTTLEEAKAQITTITDAALRDAVQTRVEHEFARREELARTARAELFLYATNIADQTGDWRKIPPADWVRLSLEERASLKRYTEQKADGQAAPKTDLNLLADLIELQSTDPERFVQYNLRGHLHELSPGDYEQLLRAQAGLRTGDDASKHAILVNEGEQTRITNDALQGMGLDPSPKTPEMAGYDPFMTERVLNFRRAVRSATQALEARAYQGKKKATDEDVQRIVDRLAAPMGQRQKAGGGLFGSATSVPAFAFEVAQARAMEIRQVPAAERRKIEAAILRNYGPGAISDAEILRWFNLALAQDRRDR